MCGSSYHVVDDLSTVVMVANGFGICLMPEMVMKDIPYEVDCFPVKPDACRIIGIAALNPDNMARAVRTFYNRVLAMYRAGGICKIIAFALFLGYTYYIGKQKGPNEIIDDKLVLDRGLKKSGFEFIEEMENLGIIIDVSHLSDAGFYDILNNTKKPFVASHSNARSICGHRRNMTDDMIKKLAHRGGVMGLNFYSCFLNNNATDDDMSKMDDMINHIKHIKNIGGIEVIGLGSDFDGIDCKVEIENASKMQILAEKMKKEGFTEKEVEHIFYKNVLNLFKEIL